LEGWAALGGAMIPSSRSHDTGPEIDLVIQRYEGTWQGGDYSGVGADLGAKCIRYSATFGTCRYCGNAKHRR
jgi:hypothetical protein